MKEPRFSSRGRSLHVMLVPPTLAVAALALTSTFFDGTAEQETPRDADLCPVDRTQISGYAAILFDFTKPLMSSQVALPSNVLRDIAQNLPSDTEMEVFSLTPSPGAPRLLLKRLCTVDESMGLKGSQTPGKAALRQSGSVLCDDRIPLPPSESAHRFCAALDALEDDLHALARSSDAQAGDVSDAYLVEAFEDTLLEFAGRPRGDRVLYVFSDMMQHAPWYSHLDLAWTDWGFSEFADRLKSRSWAFSHRIERPDMRVEVFYVPRAGRTDQSSVKDDHQKFWRRYFAGAQIAFHDQPTMSDYAAVKLMDVSTESEIAARERAAVQQLLFEVRKEQEALERQRREVASERQREVGEQNLHLATRQ